MTSFTNTDRRHLLPAATRTGEARPSSPVPYSTAELERRPGCLLGLSIVMVGAALSWWGLVTFARMAWEQMQ
ncbi:hypothetical protein [Nitratireductor sp. GCM10026969]|uniref:hypothetical protein n=1 Tax=Nitratireductor sp. GCM10026969 TaxID=3252645 RepID=UPI00360E91EA